MKHSGCAAGFDGVALRGSDAKLNAATGNLRPSLREPDTGIAKNKKPAIVSEAGFLYAVRLYLGWLMGLEPTTTGITILDSTN